EYRALEQRVAHHPVATVGSSGDLATGEQAVERRLRVGVDDEAAVLVVEDRVREDRLLQRIDARGTVAAQHVGERDLRIALGDSGRVEVDRRPPILCLQALSALDLAENRLRDGVAGPERVGELLPVSVE